MPRVLVVDDLVDAAECLALLLRLLGYEARAAFDGPTALGVASTFRPDAVVLDLAMPGMDGAALARRLRETFPQGLTIICLSGCTRESDQRRAHEAGCDHYLFKPVDVTELVAMLGPVRPCPGSGPGVDVPGLFAECRWLQLSASVLGRRADELADLVVLTAKATQASRALVRESRYPGRAARPVALSRGALPSARGVPGCHYAASGPAAPR